MAKLCPWIVTVAYKFNRHGFNSTVSTPNDIFNPLSWYSQNDMTVVQQVMGQLLDEKKC
jgi:hypothetical protein